MKIALCVDLHDSEKLKELIRISDFYLEDFTFYEYSNGEALLNAYKDFDVIFVDMQIQGRMSGALIVREIRKRDVNVLIIYYSVFDAYASKISTTRPYDYLLKNYPYEKSVQFLNQILQEIQNKKYKPKLPITCNGQIYILQLDDILYIQIYKKGSKLWIINKRSKEIGREVLITNTKIKEYHRDLNSYGFVFAGESYLINIENVISRQDYEVFLRDGHKITVARRKRKMFDEELVKYYSNKLNSGMVT